MVANIIIDYFVAMQYVVFIEYILFQKETRRDWKQTEKHGGIWICLKFGHVRSFLEHRDTLRLPNTKIKLSVDISTISMRILGKWMDNLTNRMDN